MISKSEAVKNFLLASTHPDLANLYSINMECQVNVAQDGGERTIGEFKGKKWHGWSDGVQTWKAFRIPYHASTEPVYEDKKILWDLAEHVEAIGMTGWDWKNKVSKWVAYDFDSIIGHSEKVGLTNEELEEVRSEAFDIDWVTIRKSTSGKGYHLYVYLNDVPTKNHNEHASLARSILGKLSALTGYDFQSKVDACGGNMWVWARKMLGTPGLEMLKSGIHMPDAEVPPNWKDHMKVVTGTRTRNLPQFVEELHIEDIFDELAGQRLRTPLDKEHKKLIQFLKECNAMWWWDSDHHMLVTHTMWLKQAFDDLDIKGVFETVTEGLDKNDHNCFLFPMRRGAWSVRRYSKGVEEAPSWSQDGSGWTRCYLNREPDLPTVARTFGGIENTKGGFVFREAESAIHAAQSLGTFINIGTAIRGRQTTLRQHKDGRLVVQIERRPDDQPDDAKGFLADKKDRWTKIYSTSSMAPEEPDVGNYDDLVRHLVTETREDYGWMLKSDGQWCYEPMAHVRVGLGSLGLSGKEITGVLGSSVFRAWRVVNKPFQPEYPGDREWNRNAAQLRFLPTRDKDSLYYPTWKQVLLHCGRGLDEHIEQDGWCKANGVLTGADYLKCWIASLFQSPTEPLPYLFFYGAQNTGKSMFHEAISLLLTKGYKRADAALISQAGFNAELEGAILCVTEEIDLRKNKAAYNRIKDWVTSRELLIHAKGRTPYHIPNTTHWIQCANDHLYCPIFTGDTRITMVNVGQIDPMDMIPKRAIIPKLEKEAPDFLAELMKLEIPDSKDRLNLPTLQTDDKDIIAKMNQTSLEQFISDKCLHKDGHMIKYSEFYDDLIEWTDNSEAHLWTKRRVGRELPPNIPKARSRTNGHFYLGNIMWAKDSVGSDGKILPRLVVRHEYLESSK